MKPWGTSTLFQAFSLRRQPCGAAPSPIPAICRVLVLRNRGEATSGPGRDRAAGHSTIRAQAIPSPRPPPAEPGEGVSLSPAHEFGYAAPPIRSAILG